MKSKNIKNNGLVYKFIILPSKVKDFSILTCKLTIGDDVRYIYLYLVYTTDWRAHISRVKQSGYNAKMINDCIVNVIYKINEVINHVIENKLELSADNFYSDYFLTKFEQLTNDNDNNKPTNLIKKAI